MNLKDLKVGMEIDMKPGNSDLHPIRTITGVGHYSYLYQVKGSWREHQGMINDLPCFEEVQPEPRTEILYECLDSVGVLSYYFKDGAWPDFRNGKSGNCRERDRDILKRKTGRTLILNMDTWEVVQEGAE
jgi:hypothetical protein